MVRLASKFAKSRVDLACAILACLILFAGTLAVLAEEPTEDQIIEALQPKAPNGGLGMARSVNNPKVVEERRLVDSLRTRSARSLTLAEREKVAELANDRPSIDIEINFDFDSADVGPKALRPLLTLGRALSSDRLKGSVFLINGHTDAKGSDQYNQSLSERRAEAVKRLLVEEFKLPADSLIAVGYGKAQLKNKNDPFAGENRRVQVVNTGMR
jgi:outer membrane protein OmpA-like peptidoglycan-associated protein